MQIKIILSYIFAVEDNSNLNGDHFGMGISSMVLISEFLRSF
jgi:hypothetical protein